MDDLYSPDLVHPTVRRLNDLNRAVDALAAMKAKASTVSPRWDALYEGWAAVMELRDAKRVSVSERCAPWFDGSAFASGEAQP